MTSVTGPPEQHSWLRHC